MTQLMLIFRKIRITIQTFGIILKYAKISTHHYSIIYSLSKLINEQIDHFAYQTTTIMSEIDRPSRKAKLTSHHTNVSGMKSDVSRIRD